MSTLTALPACFKLNHGHHAGYLLPSSALSSGRVGARLSVTTPTIDIRILREQDPALDAHMNCLVGLLHAQSYSPCRVSVAITRPLVWPSWGQGQRSDTHDRPQAYQSLSLNLVNVLQNLIGVWWLGGM